MEEQGIEAIETAEDKDKDFLQMVGNWKVNSEKNMREQHQRWAKNIRLVKGIFEQSEVAKSKVRNRSKLFWRKIWASNIRIMATMYQAFLKDPDSIKIEGRLAEDVPKAKVLLEMVKYRRDLMYRKSNLFRKLMWALLDIVNLSDTVGKMRWVFGEGKDEPDFVTYPLEQVFPDPNAVTKEAMKYIIFENYLTFDQLEEWGLKNLDIVKPATGADNILKTAREQNKAIPMKSLLDDSNYYPKDGSGDRGARVFGTRYRVWEILYKKNGKIWYAITNEGNCILQDTKETPLDIYPVVFGSCLLESHKLFGEGFAEPMEGPQESANATLNMRKDAVALTLAPHRIVSRYGGVDLTSLTNARVGGITLVDDINAIKEEEMKDVTGKAYMEAESDDLMMQEMSGITNQRLGMPGTPGEKATVANITYTESGTKLDLFVGTIAETFFKDFYYLLAYMIQKFETDETVFRVANGKLREVNPGYEDIFDIDNFVADFTINVGSNIINRQLEIQQAMLAMDRATMANQTTLGLLQARAPLQNLMIFNVAQFMNDLLPKIGFKDVQTYLVKLGQPQQPMQTMPMIEAPEEEYAGLLPT